MPGKRIIFINPVMTSNEINQAMAQFLNAAKSLSTERVEVVSLPVAPSHLEHHYYEVLMAQDMLKLVKQAEKNGYDGAVIGCFYDPFLDVAREISTRMVVTAPAEASMHLATTIANTFSIIVGRNKWIPQMNENVVNYGFKSHLASFRSLDLGVLDFQADKERTENRMRVAVRKAISEDRAEAIILGCTMEFGFYRKLQQEFSLPVIDCSLAALKYAEYLVEARDACGWNISKIGGFEAPAQGELKGWGMEEKYDIVGLF